MKTKKPNPIDVHVGKRIRIRRVLCGMSQTTLAEHLGITFQQLQKYESGANRVSCSRLWAMSLFLDVPVQWFFVGLRRQDEDDTDGGVQTKRASLELVRNYDRCAPDLQKRLGGLVRAVAEQTAPVLPAE